MTEKELMEMWRDVALEVITINENMAKILKIISAENTRLTFKNRPY